MSSNDEELSPGEGFAIITGFVSAIVASIAVGLYLFVPNIFFNIVSQWEVFLLVTASVIVILIKLLLVLVTFLAVLFGTMFFYISITEWI